MSDETTPIKEPPSPDQPVVPPAQADEPKGKKPIYKQWWFWAIVVVVMIVAIVAAGGDTADEVVEQPADEVVAEPEPAPEPEPEPEPAPEPAPAPAPAPTASEVRLKIYVSDWTEGNPVTSRTDRDGYASASSTDVYIWIRGMGNWFPDLEFGGDHTISSDLVVGETVQMSVYPDGQDGSEAVVQLTPDEDVISESDRDTIHVEIYDDEVLVWGTSVPDLEQAFSR